MAIDFTKCHAYGNDFLFIEDGVVGLEDGAGLARVVCDRHLGIGADGLIFYRRTTAGAAMRLFNADGSAAEVSGNGVRCLAALVTDQKPKAYSGTATGSPVETIIETEGGTKALRLLSADPPRFTFRAFMGEACGVKELDVEVGGEQLSVVVMSVGNPQCVVFVNHLDEEQVRRLGPALASHSSFPDGTNVEFVQVERSDQLRILIWERGVGPTTASGTGACGSAVAAATFGGAGRTVRVVSPGGEQTVELMNEGIYLTGWAEIIARGTWTGANSVFGGA